MKKIILLIFILFTILKVEAKTYYGPYSEYKQVDELGEKSDIMDFKVEKKYLIYKENITTAYYPAYMEITDMDKTEETKLEVSDWLDDKPKELVGRNIIEGYVYEYRDLKDVRYLKLTGLRINDGLFGLRELKITNNGYKVDYEIMTKLDNVEKIKDDDLNNHASFGAADEVWIDFKENIDIKNLLMTFYIYTTYETPIYFTMELLGEECENVYVKRNLYTYPTTLSPVVPVDSNKFNLLINPLYKEKQISEEYVKKTDLNIVNKVKKYKTEDLYIKYEKKEYQYLDDYYLEALDGYKLDLESEKEFYYSRKRDKVEINDYLIINKNDMKLEDLILFTTTPNIKITSNMSYCVNGKYDINFILPFKTIKEKLTVDIKENYINTLNVQNKYLKELELENNKLVISNNKLNTQIKEILKNKDEVVNESNDKLLKCKYELEELKDNKIVLEEDNKKNLKIPIIISSTIGLISVVFFLRKKST